MYCSKPRVRADGNGYARQQSDMREGLRSARDVHECKQQQTMEKVGGVWENSFAKKSAELQRR